MDFNQKAVSEEEIKEAMQFMMGVLLSGVSLDELRQSFYDAYPTYEELSVIMGDMFKTFVRLNDFKSFWDDGDD